jgi:NTP pyrophosphatase (non-canonical NTP hydrolase)
MSGQSLYRYTIVYHKIPKSWVDSNGGLKDKHMIDVQREYPAITERIISKNYNNPNEVLKNFIQELKDNNKDENFTFVPGHGFNREVLDAFDKNLEFSYRGELQNPNFEDKYKDVWEYLDFSRGDTMLAEEVRELNQAIDEKDPIETLDGAYDVAVIALNIPFKYFMSLGLSEDEAMRRTKEGFMRVVDSNLSKLDTTKFVAEFDPSGKILKGGGFRPPVFDDLLNTSEITVEATDDHGNKLDVTIKES